MDFIRFLYYAWYNIYSAWFLDIRIPACFNKDCRHLATHVIFTSKYL